MKWLIDSTMATTWPVHLGIARQDESSQRHSPIKKQGKNNVLMPFSFWTEQPEEHEKQVARICTRIYTNRRTKMLLGRQRKIQTSNMKSMRSKSTKFVPEST